MRKFKIFDAHCHIYPDKIAEKASLATGTFYNVDMRFDGKVSTLLEIADRAGVSKCLVHSVATTPHQVSSINRFIAEAVEISGGRFIGFGALHPLSEDIAGDVEELISLGLCGVKLHPDIQGFAADDERCMEIYREIEGRIPLLIHAGDERYDMSGPVRIANIAKSFSDLTVIAAHFGGYSQWEAASKILPELPNIMVDSSSSFWKLSDGEIREYIRLYGADRVLFGSDYPMWDASDELDRLFTLGLPEDQLEMILSGNLERLIGR